MKSCCFTGHRHIPAEDALSAKIELDVTIRRLIRAGVCHFYCGGARGFDTLAAEAVIHLKNTFPFIKLYLILPCKSQTEFWSERDKQRYSFILSHADDVQCLYETYHKRCMYERNKALVTSADVCVCYLKEPQSGTAFTVALAAKRKLKIIPLCLTEAESAAFEAAFLSPQLDLESFEFS